MHIDIIDDLNIRIYLQKSKIKNIDFTDKGDLQDYFKELFINLKNNYNININGYYYINVFKDKNYGLILEMKKEELDYIEYLDGQVDMSIAVDNNDMFFYELDDYFSIDNKIIKNIKLYKYDNKIYIQLINKISNICMAKLLEFSKIIYGEKCRRIKRQGNIINIENMNL